MVYVKIQCRYSEIYSLSGTTKKLVEEEDAIPQLKSGIFWSLVLISVCNCSFSCAFMNQLILCSPHGRNGSLGRMYNNLSAEKLVFHYVQQKAIFPCHKMRTDVKALELLGEAEAEAKHPSKLNQDRSGNLIFLLLLLIPALNPHLQLAMTYPNPLHKSFPI